MTVNEAGRLGAERRHQAEREPIRSKARAMRAALGMPPTAALTAEPTTIEDRLARIEAEAATIRREMNS